MHGILSQGVFLFMAVDREAALIRKFMEFAKLMNVYLNHFPKHERYALCNRIRNSSYEVYDLIVKRELKVKLYCRYVDDFILFNLTREQCLEYQARIVEFLRDELHLELSKWTMAKVKRGVNFVGYRTWRRARFIRKYSLFKFRRAVKRDKADSVISLLGHARRTASLPFMMRTLRETNPELYRRLPPKVKNFYTRP